MPLASQTVAVAIQHAHRLAMQKYDFFLLYYIFCLFLHFENGITLSSQTFTDPRRYHSGCSLNMGTTIRHQIRYNSHTGRQNNAFHTPIPIRQDTHCRLLSRSFPDSHHTRPPAFTPPFCTMEMSTRIPGKNDNPYRASSRQYPYHPFAPLCRQLQYTHVHTPGW